MADAYTTRGGIIQPEVGQHLNTWGTLLNDNAIAVIDKGLFGFETIAVTGDLSLTRTNGDATSTQINKGIRLAGTPTADFTVTFLGYEQIPLIVNVSGRNATVKVSAGTGVTLATGQIAFLGYNAALGDVTNVTPNVIAGALQIGGALTLAGKVSGLTAGTLGTDAVNKTQMENAIAVLAGVITNGLVLASSGDTAAGYLSVKTSGSKAVTASIVNAGGNEVRDFSVEYGAMILGGTITTGAAASNTKYLWNGTGSAVTATLPAAPTAGDRIELAAYGTGPFTLNPNGLKINGNTANLVFTDEQTLVITYSGASRGWV